MMSATPHSGIHEAQVAKTLDTTVPTPQKAQGGQMIVERASSPNGGDTCWSIGNGQVQEAMASLKECCQTLNCMHETQKIAIIREDARYRDMKDCAPTCNAQMRTGGNNVPLLVREEYERDKSGNTVCYPLNGMTINKELKEGDRQTTGIGRPDDALPTISVAHHHAVAVVRKDEENEEELPFDCALCGHRGETREVDIAEQLREEHPTWVPGWLDELGPIRLTLWGCPECNEWHTPRAWNDIQVRKTIETKLLAVLDGDKINKKERRGGSGLGISEEPVAYTNTAKDVHGVATDTHGAYTEHLTVRRLLPVETERLMGFPDNWTRIPWGGGSQRKNARMHPDTRHVETRCA